jgi:hypothetical protein
MKSPDLWVFTRDTTLNVEIAGPGTPVPNDIGDRNMNLQNYFSQATRGPGKRIMINLRKSSSKAYRGSWLVGMSLFIGLALVMFSPHLTLAAGVWTSTDPIVCKI